MKRNPMRRSFTVEIKSSERRHATIIPSRSVKQPAALRPALIMPQVDRPAPVSEPRRVLPVVIAPEPLKAEPEVSALQEEHLPRVRRAKPRKQREKAPEPADVIQSIEPVTLLQPVPGLTVSPIRRVGKKSSATLPPGQRWKRRFGAWAR